MKNRKCIAGFAVIFGLLGGAHLLAQITGYGTANSIPVWTGSSTLGQSAISQNGLLNGYALVGIANPTARFPLDVNGTINSSTGYSLAGMPILAAPGTFNLAIGNYALYLPSTGSSGDVAIGYMALEVNTSGSWNTVCGAFAATANTTGSSNTAVGSGSLGSNTTGGGNTVVGAWGLNVNNGNDNTVIGADALHNITAGSNNIVIGSYAGSLNTGSSSNNIEIGNKGASSDNGVIRIGTAGTQKSTYIAGINGVTVSGPVPVYINSNGQLGTVKSSARYKEDVHNMADASDGLLKLRPVTYRYKEAYADGSKSIDYGLIAEEVAAIYPDMVVRNAEGEIETVQYQKLTPMLLNELQKQHRAMEQQNKKLEQQESLIDTLAKRLAALEAAGR